jgi:hypothetical protein
VTLLALWAIHVNSLPVWGDTDVPVEGRAITAADPVFWGRVSELTQV